jgi:hypothetical protein
MVCSFIGKLQYVEKLMKYLIHYIRERIEISHVVIIWLLVNMTSAIFTQLYSDEAYYTLFARQLDFGYFDHPPMIALMIRIGSAIFKNEIGVRLLSVIAITVAIYFIYELAEVQKPFLFLTAIFSIFGLNILGFLALPDSPLLLFTVLFFVVYKKFLLKENIVNSILLGLSMVAMLYSKYHGILVIIFTITSNLRLIKSPKFRISLAVVFLLFIPHIIWQLNNDFVSITYHLFERSASHYKVSFTYKYLLGQLLYWGPISIIFMFISAIIFKQSTLFEKALKWNLWGFIGFFLLSTLKGRVEVNWTLPIIIPLLIFFLKSNNTKPLFEKWFYLLAIPVIIIIIFLRMEIIYPVFNFRINRFNDFRGQKELGKEIVDKCKGLPIITSNYQRAGIVSFYANTFATSINLNSRRNQFNLWHGDDSLRYQRVAYLNNYLNEGISIQNPEYKDYRITIIDSLPVMNDILITSGSGKLTAKNNEIFNVKVILLSPKDPENYRDAGNYSTRLYASLYKEDNLLIEEVCKLPIDLLLKRNRGECNFQFNAPSVKGRYRIIASLKTTELGTWSTIKTIYLTVR